MIQSKDLIGSSLGLAGGQGCEQVYVKDNHNKLRPIRIEFWEGYSIPNKAILTRGQALDLAFIILKHFLSEKNMKEAYNDKR